MGRLNSGPFLLDTHAFIWAITAPDRLGVEARTAIEAGDSQLMVSAACAWEIATKHRLGKLEKADVLVAGHGRHTSRLRAIDAAITAEHALLAGSLDWEHRDPFDPDARGPGDARGLDPHHARLSIRCATGGSRPLVSNHGPAPVPSGCDLRSGGRVRSR